MFMMGPIPLLNSRKTDRNGFLAGDSRPGRIFPNSITRVVPALAGSLIG